MRNDTRILFNNFLQTIAQLNNVPNASQQFSVEPAVQQRVEKHLQDTSAFLKKINMVPVIDARGETLGLSVTGNIASRTDTRSGMRRQPTLMGQLDVMNQYSCEKTNFDTAIRYQLLDMWARDTKFQKNIRDMIIKEQAMDRIKIGLYGTHVALNTDRRAFTMLEDVNIGWLEKIRQNAPKQVLTGPTGKIRIGAGGDYNNLDALVLDATKHIIDPLVLDDTNLVAIVGRNLVTDKLFPLVNDVSEPTQIVAAQTLLGQTRLGGLQPVRVPYFPEDKILITSLDNLSLYFQEGSRRRNIRDEPEYDRIANYESSNDAYVIEYYGAACLIEGIEIL